MVSLVKFRPLDIDDTELSFGMHKGMTPNQLLDLDPRYIVWMFENVEPKPCSKELYEESERVVEDQDHTEDQWSIY